MYYLVLDCLNYCKPYGQPHKTTATEAKTFHFLLQVSSVHIYVTDTLYPKTIVVTAILFAIFWNPYTVALKLNVF